MDTHGFEGINPALAGWDVAFVRDDRPGPDWVTTQELAAHWKIAEDAARHRAERTVARARAERRKINGRTYYLLLVKGA